MSDPLRARLFGYGVPYRAHLSREGAEPLETSAGREAGDLAGALEVLCGGEGDPLLAEDAWALSLPFGRCGVEGLPREHLMVHHAREARLEVLSLDGFEERALGEGELFTLVPGQVVRLVARPEPGRRVLVAFQTEDRTPLLGHAAPFSLDGEVPADWRQRVRQCHAAFAQVRRLMGEEPQRARGVLETFFARMAAAIAGRAEIEAARRNARAEGAYEGGDEVALFTRQRQMLTQGVLARIRAGDERLFRFPGMFGGIATLFRLTEE